MGDETFAEITVLPISMPTSWTPATAFNGRMYADIEIQVIGTPTVAYVFQDSFDNINFNDCTAWDRNGATLASITAAGRYRLPGSCYVKARQGTGSTFLIRAGS